MSKHVVFIGVDGVPYSRMLGLDKNAITKLDHLESYVGGVVGTSTQQVTSSGPGWSTLLTGVWVDEHGIKSNSNSPIKPAVNSLFERIEAGIANAKTASIVHWRDINTGHFKLETGLGGQPGIVDFVATGLGDQAVTTRGSELILTEAPTFTFLHLDDVDHAGHSSGNGQALDDSIRTAANQIDEIMTAVALRQAENPGEDWLVVVSTDHGRSANGYGHGGQSASERQTFIAANKEISSATAAPATSVAATILEFLGLSTDGIAGPSVLDAGAIDTHAPFLLDVENSKEGDVVATDASLRLILSEAVRKGTGAITIHQADGTVVEAIDVNSAQVTVAHGVVTVKPSAAFLPGTSYYVTVSPGAFVDLETRGPSTIYSENFEGLTSSLRSYTSSTEKVDSDLTDWTPDAPAGWTHLNNTNAGGVPEFNGWTFHDKQAWIETAADQGRAEFTKGAGVVAVVDGDEYYDMGKLPNGAVKTKLVSPEINLKDVATGTAQLSFDSSWIPETPQEVRVTVSFDGGAAVELLHWSSASGSANFHAKATNESITLKLDNPAGAANAVLTFEMVAAGNNWWWAVDNIKVDAVKTGVTGGNAFAGVTDATTWAFTTAADTAAPVVLSVVPTDGAAEVKLDAPIVLTFNEDVVKGKGNITIWNKDGVAVETIDVASQSVSVTGAKVSIQPANLAGGQDYRITVDAGAFEDTALRATVRTLFAEDFEGLTSKLGSYVSPTEQIDDDLTDWTATAPDGWTHVNTTAAGGVTEFNGWTFHDKEAWTATAGDQGRSAFTKATGVVALVDGDEYYDTGKAPSNAVHAALKTPEIDLASVGTGRVMLDFFSSWVPEEPQEARILLTFDNGATLELARWDSEDGSANFKSAAANESAHFEFDVPAGATKASITFEMLNSGNNWWWAVDNIKVSVIEPELHGNAFAGITLADSWDFKTVATGSNQAPDLLLSAKALTLAEGTVAADRALADVTVKDDGVGTNVISVSDSRFAVENGKLVLKAGSVLDFEAGSTIAVKVSVDDASIGTGPEDIETFTLTLTDVVEGGTGGDTGGGNNNGGGTTDPVTPNQPVPGGSDSNDTLTYTTTLPQQIDGKGGFDTVRLPLSFDAVKIVAADGGFRLEPVKAGQFEPIFVANIEAVEFLGGVTAPNDPGSIRRVALDSSKEAAAVHRLYDAAFSRDPDTAGLTHWAKMLKGGESLSSVAEMFAFSPEFTRGQTLTDDTFVARVYENAFGRAPDTAGLAHWVKQLQGGSSRGEILVAISESQEHVKSQDAAVKNGVWTLSEGVEYRGTASADTIKVASLPARVDGGAGTDKVVFTANFADVKILSADKGFEVIGTKGGQSASLSNVEHLVFGDGTELKLDTSATSAKLVRLFDAAFDRPGDIVGLSGWAKALSEGKASLASIADAFVKSAEFASRFGADLSDAGFVQAVYENAFGRSAEPAGLAGWVKAMGEGKSRGDVLTAIAESAEHIQLTGNVTDDGVWLMVA